LQKTRTSPSNSPPTALSRTAAPSFASPPASASKKHRRSADDEDDSFEGDDDYDYNDSFIDDSDDDLSRKRRKPAAPVAPVAAAAVAANVLSLPDVLKNVRVFFYQPESGDALRKLERIVISLAGDVDNYMADDTTHVVTDRPWDKSFEAAAASSPTLVFVKSEWLLQCLRQNRHVDEAGYLILP